MPNKHRKRTKGHLKEDSWVVHFELPSRLTQAQYRGNSPLRNRGKTNSLSQSEAKAARSRSIDGAIRQRRNPIQKTFRSGKDKS